MQRFLPVAAIGALVALVVAGAAWLAIDDGPYAFRVNGHEVSQRSVDDELRALVESEELNALVAQGGAQPISSGPGSTSSGVAAGWVGLRVAQELAAQGVERRELAVTAAGRQRGRELAVQAMGGDRVFRSLPEWFRERLTQRWTRIAVLEQELLENPTGALQEATAAQCPSGRYVAHILVATAEEAEAIRTELEGGADFAEIAQERSQDTGSAANGGDLGCLDGLQGAVEPFLAAATNQPDGVLSEPVPTEFGFHLILVSDQPSSDDLATLGVDAVIRELTQGQDVDVDPRYGRWDRANGQVLPPNAPTATQATANG